MLPLVVVYFFYQTAYAQNVGPLGSEIKWIGALAWGAITLIVWGISGAFMATDWQLWVGRGKSGRWLIGIISVSLLTLVAIFLGIAGITIAWASLGQARHKDPQDTYSACLATYCAHLGFLIFFGFSLFNRRSLAWAVIFWLLSGGAGVASLVLMWWLSRTAFGIFFFLPVWFVILGIILFVVHKKNSEYTSEEVVMVEHREGYHSSSGPYGEHEAYQSHTTASSVPVYQEYDANVNWA